MLTVQSQKDGGQRLVLSEGFGFRAAGLSNKYLEAGMRHYEALLSRTGRGRGSARAMTAAAAGGEVERCDVKLSSASTELGQDTSEVCI